MEIDVKILRGALRGYGDLRGLARSPLVGILDRSGAVPGHGGRSAGLALREALRTGIEALRPDPGDPRPEERRWRPYLILSERYLRGRSAEWTRDLLHLARTTFFEEQDRAVGLLAAVLERGGGEDGGEADPLGPTSASPRVPFMAPPRSPRSAVGRALLLEALRRRLIEGEERAIALVGLPGVGKTTLALELAHDREVRSRFPDGVLWASLGPDPDPLLWLDRWGEAAGLPPETLRAGGTLAERGARVRKALEGRRMLLVLDDVWRTEVALGLRVGGPFCVHLLTARRPDVALDFGEAVERIRELDLTEGLALLRELAPQAVEADRASCERIVRALGGLPLGLVLAGRFLAHRSHGSQARRIREALAALEDPRLRMSLLPSDPRPGEAEAGSLRAVIGLSDAALPREAREVLSALALFPPKPNSFSEGAALAVSGGDPSALDALVDQGLLEGLPPDRYTLHRSLHDYARGRPPGPEAPRRLVAHYADLVRLRGDEWDILERERDNLLAAYRTALEEGMAPEILLLATGLYWLHERSGAYSVCEAVLTRARAFLERRGEGPSDGGTDGRGEAEDGGARVRLLSLLGDLWVRRGCSDRGIPILREAFRASRGAGMEEDGTFSLTTYLMAAYLSGRGQTVWETCEQLARWFETLSPGTPQREAVATVLGFLFGEVGDPDRAEAYLQEALREMRRPDKANRRLEGWVRNIRGTVLLHRSEWGPAGAELDESLRIYRQVGDRRGEGWDFCQLARLDRQLGRFGEADRKIREAENIFRGIGELMGRGYALHIRARLRLDAGREDREAEAEARESLAIHRELNCGIGVACAQLVLALPLLRRGRGEGEARERIREALELRRRGRFRRGESRALAWLAWADLLAGRTGEALEEAREAEAVARTVGSPNTRAGALTILGRVLLEREELSAAEEAFREAQEIRELLVQPHFLAEPLAGRIAVARTRGDAPVAAALAARVPRGEGGGLLPGAEDPDWVRETLGLGS